MLLRVALVSLAAAGCDGSGTRAGSSGSYGLPSALIGLPLASDNEQLAVREILTNFAEDYDLELYQPAHGGVPPSLRDDPRRQFERTTYHPIPAWLPEGIQVDLIEVSSECWLIHFYDRSPTWVSESVTAFYDLHERLTSPAVPKARAFIEPVVGEDETHRYESGVSVEHDELCAEMGVSAAAP